ncbi:MAG: sugar phosphate isomerase/epimerase [Bacteroidales bacterium]|nr:sugar phosphate isomerase/epimerase [Bacteroidales bacterium]
MKRNRRDFVKISSIAGIGLTVMNPLLASSTGGKSGMKFGLVTYLWGKDWDLPTLIANCEKAGYHGVELRTQHAHGVETSLNALQRAEVKKRFEDSSVTCIGYGSNFEYHSPDPAKLRENIDQTKEYIKLCKDIGATGIKVKPNNLPDGIPKEKTITQIADGLNEVGAFAGDYGQVIRVEVHGRLTAELPNMRAIFEQVTDPNVKICWNCNDSDLLPPGLEGNFNMVKKWFGDTVHIRELNTGEYPYQELFNLFTGIRYEGWILLEARTKPEDRVAAMEEQLSVFNKLIANAENV